MVINTAPATAALPAHPGRSPSTPRAHPPAPCNYASRHLPTRKRPSGALPLHAATVASKLGVADGVIAGASGWIVAAGDCGPAPSQAAAKIPAAAIAANNSNKRAGANPMILPIIQSIPLRIYATARLYCGI